MLKAFPDAQANTPGLEMMFSAPVINKSSLTHTVLPVRFTFTYISYASIDINYNNPDFGRYIAPPLVILYLYLMTFPQPGFLPVACNASNLIGLEKWEVVDANFENLRSPAKKLSQGRS